MENSKIQRGLVSLGVAAMLALGPGAIAQSVSIGPSKDNTLYEDANGSLSNGVGQHIFAGRTAITNGALVRRAVVAFDVAGNVPAGATIESVTLTLHLSRAPFGATLRDIRLHRLLADWGEGTSDATLQEGGGAPSTAGDATWRHRFFNTEFWTTNGGDFSPTVSAVQAVGGTIGNYTWGPTAQMSADVQDWLDDPASNFGWILVGDESDVQTARRFDSREIAQASFRPVLDIEYSVGAGGAGRVPDGDSIPGAPLTLVREQNGDVTLTWDISCVAGDDDYEVYEGVLGDPTSHAPRFCSTGGATSQTLTPSPGNVYYLIVPRTAAAEGSYGTDSNAAERPVSASACVAQSVAACF